MSAAAHSHAHGHDHAHDHDHTAGASSSALTAALGLTSAVLVAELAGAWWFNSLALFSDATHMLTDVAALAIALAAIRIGARPADARRTFGYKRFEILAAAFNALLLFAAALYIFAEAIGRFRAPEPVGTGGMIAVAAFGMIANLAAMRVLASSRGESMAAEGAYLEVWSDMIGSAGVIAGAVLIHFTGRSWIDPLVAIAVALWVLPRTWRLLARTLHVLLEGVPDGLRLDEVRGAIAAIEGVADVHDLHVWSMSTSEVSLTAHVMLREERQADGVRRAVADALGRRFHIAHCTIQTEVEPCGHAHVHP